MCFSATASFSSGAVLTVIGFASLNKTIKPSQRLFAVIPLLFAVQQFAEGFLWIALSNPNHVQMAKISTTAFIVIAQIIWPFWVPLSILQLENKRIAKVSLTFFTVIGFAVSLYLAWCLIVYGAKAEIAGYHISYLQTYPDIFNGFGGYFYVLVTVFPPFISLYKKMWVLGLAILISYLVTKMYYGNYLISVWCFFAAAISSIVYFILKDIKDKSIHFHSGAVNDLL